MREKPDIETSSADYARRFAGPVGAYLISVQNESIRDVLTVPFGKTVLDVGGGHGQLATMLLESGYDVTVFGSSNECYKRLKNGETNRSLKFVTGNLLNLPFSDKSIDLVISVRLISHITHWPLLIREFCRVARNSIVIDYPSLVSFNGLTPFFFKIKKLIEKNTRTYTSFHKSELEREFTRSSFEISATKPQFFVPMGLHRALGKDRLSQRIEEVFTLSGLTRVLGSPVILRADRLISNNDI